MMDSIKLNSTTEYALRFGKIAILKGFITEHQLEDALDEQINLNVIHNTHKLIGEILLDKGLMTPDQIAIVLDNLSNIKVYFSNYLTSTSV